MTEQLAANDENNQQTSEEILLSTIDGLSDDKLTGFALRLVLTAHTPIPREGELDLLTEAEAAVAPPQPKKTASKKTKTATQQDKRTEAERFSIWKPTSLIRGVALAAPSLHKKCAMVTKAVAQWNG